jgi:tetratricopeptide (TPR) repeat protein
MAMILVVVSGCATPQGKIKEAPVAQAPVEIQGPTVIRLEKQGQGFMGFEIREIPQMDADTRKAFDQAAVLIGRREFRPAIDLLEPVVARSPGVSAPHINLAMAYAATDEKEKAKAQLKHAIRLIPDHPVACNVYGLLCRKNGDFSEAREYYEKAAKGFPEYYPVHRNLGILCDLYLNDPDCALKHYELYSAARPEDQQVKLWIADLRNRLGKR